MSPSHARLQLLNTLRLDGIFVQLVSARDYELQEKWQLYIGGGNGSTVNDGSLCSLHLVDPVKDASCLFSQVFAPVLPTADIYYRGREKRY